MSGDLSAFLPKSFGSKKSPRGKKISTTQTKEDPLSSFLPTSFGMKRKNKKIPKTSPAKKQRIEEFTEPTIVNRSSRKEPFSPPEQPQTEIRKVQKQKSQYPLPISECVELKAHKGAVLSLGLDPSGSRLISGSTDFHVRFWDFAGMMSDYRSFRKKEIEEGHPVVDIRWNGTGSEFLVSTASLTPKIFNRDGKLTAEYMKGDPYILDMQHTRGHVAAICNVSWDCNNYDHFITASADSTVRIWDVSRKDIQLQLIKAKNQKNTRVPITTMNTSPWDSSKNLISIGCSDGSIQLWPMKGPYRIPSITIRSAHQNNSEISSVQLSRDGNMLVSRGGDDTLKFWDLRNTKKPMAEFQNLENVFQQTNCCFSPDERIVVTGTSARPGAGIGKMKFFDTEGCIEETHEIDVCDNSVISLAWHEKLNQIMVGCGDNVIRVYHSTAISHNGVLMARGKDPKKKKIQGYVEGNINVHTPNSLELFKDAPSARRQKIKDRRDPKKSKRPDLPVVAGTKGHSGQVGSGLSQHLVQNMIIANEDVKDAREALLKYHDVSASDPVFFGDAYKQTQPKTLFADIEEEDEPE